MQKRILWKKWGVLLAALLVHTAMWAAGTNVARNRAAYHSSAIDYDKTAHLVTNGIKATYNSPTITCQYNDSPSGESKEMAFDGTIETKFLTKHNTCWIQYAFSGGQSFVINKYTLASANDVPARDPKSWTLQASNDGTGWTNLDTQTDITFSERKQIKTFTIGNTTSYKMYRLNVTANNGDSNLQFSEIGLYEGSNNRIEKLRLSSQWVSKNAGNQWIYIDLGAKCNIESVKLFWGTNYAKSYSIEFSDDAKTWQAVYSTTSGQGGAEEIPVSGYASYVRLRLTASSGTTYELVEMEVYGSGAAQILPKPLPAPLPDGTQYLSGGNWKLQRAEQVDKSGIELSKSAFNDSDWIIATVPGTVLTSYLNNGAIPDPNFGDQQLQISEAFFTADFWYRNSFVVPASYSGKRIFLNFNGINWKADIYVNGNNAGRIEGAFIRGKFDITNYVTPGSTAYLAVYIYKNDTPGAVTLQSLASAGGNGGALGADNPTIHASVGWDWVPTIRGRNIGIQDEVFLSSAGAISIENPFVKVKLNLPDTTVAKLTLTVDLINNTNQAVSGTLTTTLAGSVDKTVSLAANETKTVTFDDIFVVNNPKLWWPNGYGEQFLYDLKLEAKVNGKTSDTKETKIGIREVTHTTTGQVLTIFINGKRIFLRGGNWGLSESMLRFNEKDYDNCVKLHKDQNFTMIRNWVGMTGSEYFYKACDKYGILIWDDFWLANPSDGPNPNDETMFMKNVRDKIKRVRNHPSVAFYCGRNEGLPPVTLNATFKETVNTMDGTRHYISTSADHPDFKTQPAYIEDSYVSGWGAYHVQDPKDYFKGGGTRIHSERGQPNVPVLESMQAMMPGNKLWPINDMWGIHDFCTDGAMQANKYRDAVNKYGTATGIEDFCLKSQMVNMENHKAMFEACTGAKSNGLLMWMSHPAWPSTVWQTYDYYLEQTAGYYGCRKACEPLHILWDANDNRVKVANNTGKTIENIYAKTYVYNMSGALQWSDSLLISSISDEVKTCNIVSYPKGISPVHFIKLKLMKGEELLSDNFYWRATSYQNYESLQTMNKITLYGSLQKTKSGNKQKITVKLENPNNEVALMIRLRVLDKNTGERILPVLYSDNYFSLLPNETKTVTMEFESDKTPEFKAEGWNVIEFKEGSPINNITNIENDNSQIKLYPNPTDGMLYVHGINNFDVQVFDIAGTKVLQKTQQKNSINISSLAAGMYLVSLSNKDLSYSSKILLLNN